MADFLASFRRTKVGNTKNNANPYPQIKNCAGENHSHAAVEFVFMMLSESCLSLLNERSKTCCICNCDIRKNLTVKLDACLLKAVHESGVAHVIKTACSVDTNDPESSELSLLISSVTVSIVTGLKYLLVSNLKELALMTPVTLCCL